MDNELLPFYIKRKETPVEEPEIENEDCKDGFCSIKPSYLSLDQLINKLEFLRQQYGGDLNVVSIDYDLSNTAALYKLGPAVVTHPYNPDKFVLTFD
jgi:hypothetical protein